MDKANPRNHSQTAYALLASYYIGELNGVSAAGSNNPSSVISVDNTTSDVNTNTNNAVVNTPKVTNLTLTGAIISQHNTAGDCWVTAGNNVYNVTSYIRSHPGGQSNITKYCGKDIAAAFAGQGHSANASNIFASYKIGTIGSSVPTEVVTTPPTNTNQNIGNNEYEEEEDDD
jgi:cytochrome b involved in lipid metabolism